MNIVSDFGHNNISHILRLEILPLSRMQISDLKNSNYFVVNNKIDQKISHQKWRKFILANIFSSVEYVPKRKIRRIDNPLHMNAESAFDPHNFIDYPPRSEFIELINYMKERTGICDTQNKYVLLSQRERDNRYLFDANSKLPLQSFLSDALNKIGIPFKFCDFAELDPVDQAKVSSGAAIFVSAHGAALTNMIFVPDNCFVMEFNLRKHWYCDPLCDAHFSGALANDEECDGKLTFRPHFHKADYSNLSKLLDKTYIELDVDRYEGHYGRNPLSRKRLFVDGDNLIARIRENFVG